MASEHSYAPGLRVTSHATLRKERRLPLAGKVLVAVGAKVGASDVVAHAELPGDVATVNVVNQLGISAGEVPRYMLKKVGEKIGREEVLARTQPWIKWMASEAKSPADGVVETISRVTGQVIIRMAPRPLDVLAYVDGTVVEVWPGEGVLVETRGALVQGILGIGGEVTGEIAIAAKGPGEIIRAGDLTEGLAGKIVVAGAMITRDVFDRASKIGVAALVSGGFHDTDLRDLLGYDLGVAITGHEEIRPTLIITEGFGEIAMARRTYELLAMHAGKRASANGATQIRAGVLRPEIIVPLAGEGGAGDLAEENMGLTVGCAVRIIRAPGFGQLGTVKSLPPEARRVESEAMVRIVEISLADGQSMIVPRTNVEVIGS